MNISYLKYMALLLLIVILSVIIAAVYMLRLHGKVRKKQGKSVERAVRAGHQHGKCHAAEVDIKVNVKPSNISVFFDRSGNVTIIPYVPDLFGSGKATTDVTFLVQPFKPEMLGGSIRNSLASCHKGKPSDSIQLMEKLQARDWKSFTEGKLNLSVYCKDGAGIVFNTTVRTAEGAYVLMKKGAEFSLPAGADDISIGLKVLELVKRCK